jgi:hypothetical protein
LVSFFWLLALWNCVVRSSSMEHHIICQGEGLFYLWARPQLPVFSLAWSQFWTPLRSTMQALHSPRPSSRRLKHLLSPQSTGTFLGCTNEAIARLTCLGRW